MQGRPLLPGSVSLRLYPHHELDPVDIVAELLAQGRQAEAAGFDGLMVSEHHNGFGGYLPNPIQAAGWLLEATTKAWAAPCPLLLPLRPVALVVEEIAWLAARFPGRVAVGLAAGSLDDDFTLMGLTKTDLATRFGDALSTVSRALLGLTAAPLDGDPAVRRCASHPVAVVSAAMSPAAVRRAAAMHVGLLLDSLTTTIRSAELVRSYVDAGGPGPVVLVRRVWIGAPPRLQQARQLDLYRGYATRAATRHWDDQQMLTGAASAVAEGLAKDAATVGADCLNLRVHMQGLAPADACQQIDALAEVRAELANHWSGSGPAAAVTS
jgi:alkanesulfonate monooxygenase SsuD/methylene tetrahydromethanopterin reductase-like flavin-dependent oxidoreductase (luciferase family)